MGAKKQWSKMVLAAAMLCLNACMLVVSVMHGEPVWVALMGIGVIASGFTLLQAAKFEA